MRMTSIKTAYSITPTCSRYSHDDLETAERHCAVLHFAADANTVCCLLSSSDIWFKHLLLTL